MICHLGMFARSASLALAASGCTLSLLEPQLAAFEAGRPGFAGMILLPHNRKQGLSLLRLPHKLDCSLHQLSGGVEAPTRHHNNHME